ncbi:hypothetical protein SELMODRAFT_133904 [Selaginella moellendorffii]|uniref:rRNA adenine N(6)-methyltransferase n=1 Tax=Selaginella moellendorffii TaxID=88036 RepID=D8T7X0_SELML|nr:hypothetical protein SELMODRAFT_133904 [Selaginella moellendorffii]
MIRSHGAIAIASFASKCDELVPCRGAKCSISCGATSSSSSSSSNSSENYRRTLEALKSKNRRPKRWLGQNYMVNSNINDEIVRAAEIQPGDLVLEIGPGTGALTDSLLCAGAYVIAVEKDPDMVSLVSERFKDNPRVKVLFQDDILKWHIRLHLSNWMETIKSPSKLVKVVSNLPFNITTDVVKKLLPMGDLFSNVVLLLQDEAAARFIDDSPKGDEYRPISIFIRFFSEMEYKFKVDRLNFFPPPPVNGAVVSFSLKDSSQYPEVKSVKRFFTLVNSAFTGKRKMLRTSLRHLYSSSEVENALCSIGVIETARPHQLSFSQFVKLHNTLAAQSVTEMDKVANA